MYNDNDKQYCYYCEEITSFEYYVEHGCALCEQCGHTPEFLPCSYCDSKNISVFSYGEDDYPSCYICDDCKELQ